MKDKELYLKSKICRHLLKIIESVSSINSFWSGKTYDLAEHKKITLKVIDIIKKDIEVLEEMIKEYGGDK